MMQASPAIRPGCGNWPSIAARLVTIARKTRSADIEYARTGEWRSTEVEILDAVADIRQFTHFLRVGWTKYGVTYPTNRRRFAEQVRLRQSTRDILCDLGIMNIIADLEPTIANGKGRE